MSTMTMLLTEHLPQAHSHIISHLGTLAAHVTDHLPATSAYSADFHGHLPGRSSEEISGRLAEHASSLAASTSEGCSGLDASCSPDQGGAPGSGEPGGAGQAGGADGAVPAKFGIDIPFPDFPNPFGGIGDDIAAAAAQAWTAAMLAFWTAGLYVLKLVLGLTDYFLTPDLSAGGPGKDAFSTTLWLGMALVVIMMMVQLGLTVVRRDGKSLARALIGTAQFGLVASMFTGYCVAIVAACGALTKALMSALLGVNTWNEWDPMTGIDVRDVTDGTVATVLAFLGLILWIAAIAHILVYIGRAGALLILTATTPIAAAGLPSDAGKDWFWKAFRWFHAAAFTPVLMVLVLGLGIQMANGAAAGLGDDTAKAIGTAIPAVVLICIAAVSPMALFKLLAFVDPATSSGGALRQGLALQGGVAGLLSGGGGGGGTSDAASKTDDNGRSGGESSADATTSGRFSSAGAGGSGAAGGSSGGSGGGALGALGGALGAGLGKGIGLMQTVGSQGANLMSDYQNQAGVGHPSYGQPDFSNSQRGSNGRGSGGGTGGGSDSSGQGDTPSADNGSGDSGDSGFPAPPPPTMPPTAPPTMPPATAAAGPPGGSNSSSSGPSGGPGSSPTGQGKPGAAGPGGAGGAGGGAAGAAEAIPPVA